MAGVRRWWTSSLCWQCSAGTSEIRFMLRRRAKEFARPKSSIGSVKIEQFHGDRKKPFVQEGQLKAETQLYQRC